MSSLNLSQIRTRYVVEGRSLTTELEAELRADPRAGARAILEAIEKRRHERRAEGQRLRKMLRYESALWTTGLTRIAGVDDSKKLDPRTRETLAAEIKQGAVAWSVAFVEVDEIDRINIYWAGLLAMRRAVEGLGCAPEHLLLDARSLKDVPTPQTPIVKGDAKSLSIAAASILAKTARDALMTELDAQYPGYGFAKHKGYPVKEHVAALEKLGACPAHRNSFAPVRKALGLPPLPPWPTAAERAQLTLPL